jgi:hypothetical protein
MRVCVEGDGTSQIVKIIAGSCNRLANAITDLGLTMQKLGTELASEVFLQTSISASGACAKA